MKSAQKYPFLRVGITGGIGSGKSTVCALFGSFGRFVIEADEIARRLVDEDSEVKGALEREFGSGAYLPGGALDRTKMAAIIFADAKKRKQLNSIIHPHVFRTIDKQLQLLSSSRIHPYVLLEAALIYETGMDDILDYVVVVMADEEMCIQRVMKRDGVSRKEVLQRIASQMPVEKKSRQADFVIHNNGTVDDIRPAAMFLDHLLLQLTNQSAE